MRLWGVFHSGLSSIVICLRLVCFTIYLSREELGNWVVPPPYRTDMIAKPEHLSDAVLVMVHAVLLFISMCRKLLAYVKPRVRDASDIELARFGKAI